ncbi:HK97-gp10 family putative phage morphogenesis protein, partial [Altererythrobacter lutimaris]
MKFELKGIEQALKNIAALGQSVSDEDLQQVALAALEPVAKDAQSLAPVDEGDLRNSIEPRILEYGTVGVVSGDWKGHFFEFGTVNMRAQPMLGPAWHENEDAVIQSFGGRVG